MISKNKIIIGTVIVGLSAGVLLYFLLPNEKSVRSKVVVIDNYKVFEEFQMKKDYDSKIEADFMHDKNSLDSIGMLINQTKDENDANKLKKEFVLRKNLFDKQFNDLSQKYTKEVYARLNIYLKEYGNKHDIDVIIGSNSSGNVMYVKDGIDITEDLIKYINKEYSN